MTVLRDVNDHRFAPAEQEVAGSRAEGHGDAQEAVVGHEDQHEQVGHADLEHVQQRLDQVRHTQHPLAAPGWGTGRRTQGTEAL